MSDKVARAIWRLENGQTLYQLPSGQFKFGGNKFVPNRVAQRLPIEETFAGNDGRVAYKLRHDYQQTLKSLGRKTI